MIVKLAGDYRFDANIDDVWRALAGSLPGCENRLVDLGRGELRIAYTTVDVDGRRVEVVANLHVEPAGDGTRLICDAEADTSERKVLRHSLDGLRDSIVRSTSRRHETSELAAAVTREVAKTFVLLPALVMLLVVLVAAIAYLALR
jgi:hypothetical protein